MKLTSVQHVILRAGGKLNVAPTLSLSRCAIEVTRRGAARPPFRFLVCFLAIFLLGVHSELVDACTTGVISGKATVDGRPLLWKNRDAPNKDNQVVYLSGEGYACTAVVNAGSRSSIWMGVNEAGFCIENSVTRDLSEKGAKGLGNGGFMLRALQNCATLEEFEAMLESTNGKRATNANFGVIDALGGAAIFESSPSSFKKFDANDPEVAPKGYVVRSNFSFTGSNSIDTADPAQVAEIYSGARFLRGCQLVDMAIADGGVSVAYLLQHNTRDYSDLKGMPIIGSVNGPLGALPPQIDTSHTISRRTSVSAAVFHGVKPGEDPRLTTMWTMLGEPAFTIAVPCWVGTGAVAEELGGKKTSALNDASRALRDQFYVDQEIDEKESQQVLVTSALPELWMRTLPRERSNLEAANKALNRWRAGEFDAAEAMKIHRQISQEALIELTSFADSLLSTSQP
jgi:hypothetical protein